MTTFLHTGDEHIDADTHGTINPATGISTAWESNYRTIRHLAETAVERRVDAFISAGDSFKNGRPSQEALLLFTDAMTPVAEAGIPVVLLDGNHNINGVPSDHRSAIHVLAEMLRARGGEVHIAAHPELIRLRSGLQVAALPWLSKNRILNGLDIDIAALTPAEGDTLVAEHGMRVLEQMAADADLSAPLIMASHVTVDDLRIDAVTDGFTRGSEVDLSHLFSEPVLPRKQLEKLPFQYGALSHIHTPQKMSDRYYYAGSPNRLTFTDARDLKGGNLVTLGTAGALDVEKIVTPARHMVQIDLDKPDYDQALDTIDEGTLVQIQLETGNPEVPREIRTKILAAGATLADTKARPKPRQAVTAANALPEKVDPITALKTWAETNLPTNVQLHELVSAAEKLAS